MENKIRYSIAAVCDKAGRPANQDNYWVCPDLTLINTPLEGDDKLYTLSDLGALLVVADGMGGMKSGEVASQIVIDSIKARFSAIPPAILNNDTQITDFMRSAVIDADNGVKAYSREHPESHGMGSTVVMCWILNGKAYVGWTGDSRAYVFNPHNRLERLTHDHSYVQLLVDNQQITEEESFHHPQGNVITHSVGDTEATVHFDTLVYPVHKDDIFLLCSDGLCGLLNDATLDSMMRGSYSMQRLLTKLWDAGCAAGWTDNATIELLRVSEAPVEAGAEPEGWKQLYKPKNTPNRMAPIGVAPAQPTPATSSALDPNAPPVGSMPSKTQNKHSSLLMMVLGALVAMILIFVAIFFLNPSDKKNGKDKQPEKPKIEQTAQPAPAQTPTPTAAPTHEVNDRRNPNPLNNRHHEPTQTSERKPTAKSTPSKNEPINAPKKTQQISTPSKPTTDGGTANDKAKSTINKPSKTTKPTQTAGAGGADPTGQP